MEKRLREFTLSTEFTLNPGELLAIAGPSGSGKTTILECISGLRKIDRGFIKLGSSCFFDSQRRMYVPPAKRKIGLIFQGYALFEHLTVWDNIMYGVSNSEKSAGRDRAQELIDMLGIASLQQCYPATLSGGERQRVALARALVPQPDLLLMDEPLAALDRNMRHKLRKEIEELPSQWSIPVIVVTHCKCEEYLAAKVLQPVIHKNRVNWSIREKEELLSSEAIV